MIGRRILLGVSMLSFFLAGHCLGMVSPHFVPIGDAGNAPDPETGYGAVSYDFSISQRRVTYGDYCEFLNAVAADDTFGLYSNWNFSNPNLIVRSGSSGSYQYAVSSEDADMPAGYVSYRDTVRFANWMHNGQPSGIQDSSTTEDGAYLLQPAHELIVKKATARFWIPSENEWYKAMYFQPASQGGDVDNYWLYPSQSNVAFSGSPSFYSVWWDEGLGFPGSERLDELYVPGYDYVRVERGGSWGPASSGRGEDDGDDFEFSGLGFRIAVPEPTTATLLMTTSLIFLGRRRRT